ncbi:MAG: hypothetical protein ACRDHL_01730, partial [Candidatus Promineifilaceae bacterium]
ISAGAVHTRARPPEPVKGITIRPAGPDDLEAVAEGLNDFYQGYNFYEPHTAGSLVSWLAQSPFETPFNHYYVVVDAAEEVLAGAAVSEQYRTIEMRVHHIPWAMRWLNKLVKFVPADGALKQIGLSKIWFAPGQLKAAQFLWETIRWEWRQKANTLTVFFGPRSPVADMVKIPAWLPKGHLVLAVNGPVPMNEDRLIYPI